MNWEPLVDLITMQRMTARTLDKPVANKVWHIDKFLAAIPDGAVRSYKASVVGFPGGWLPQCGIGVDPGLRLGLAYIEAEDVMHAMSMYVNRAELTVQEMLGVFHAVPILFPAKLNKQTPVVVEGPSYNARYGQPLLGEIRGALILGFSHTPFQTVSEVAPLSIRKQVFGNGKIKPRELWKSQKKFTGPDALDAIAMAVCAGV